LLTDAIYENLVLAGTTTALGAARVIGANERVGWAFIAAGTIGGDQGNGCHFLKQAGCGISSGVRPLATYMDFAG